MHVLFWDLKKKNQVAKDFISSLKYIHGNVVDTSREERYGAFQINIQLW